MPYLLSLLILAAVAALIGWLATALMGTVNPPLWFVVLLALVSALTFRPLLALSRHIILRYPVTLPISVRLEKLEKFSVETDEVAETEVRDDYTDYIVNGIRDNFNARSVYLFGMVDENGELYLENGTDMECLPQPEMLRFSPGFANLLVTDGGFVYRQEESLPENLQTVSEQDIGCLNLLDARVIAPIVKAENLGGLLVLGPRANGEEYVVDDMHMLRIIIGQLASQMDCLRLRTELLTATEQPQKNEGVRFVKEKVRHFAHDFSNILTTILGMSQLARRQADDERLNSKLEVIEQAADNGRNMIDDFRRDTGSDRKPEMFRPLNIISLIETSLVSLRPELSGLKAKHGIDIVVETKFSAGADVSGDEAELQEALVNILANAVEAMADGGKLILATDIDGDDVIIAIADTGVGISADEQQHIFEPFYSTRGGEGIGLPLALDIVRRHGGDIIMESSPGAGSIFAVRLPLIKKISDQPVFETGFEPPINAPAPVSSRPVFEADFEPPANPPPPKRQVAPPSAITGSTPRVLLTDSDRENLSLLAETLNHYGYEVDVAASADEAKNIVAGRFFDLILLDIDMPGPSCWDMTAKLRERARSSKVIFCSGGNTGFDPMLLLEHNISGVMAYPFSADELLVKVRQVLSETQSVSGGVARRR